MLKKYGSDRRFFYSDIDQHVIIVLLDKQQFMSLNGLLNIFIPMYLDEDREISV